VHVTVATARRAASLAIVLVLAALPADAGKQAHSSHAASAPPRSVAQLCEALQTLPETRRASCCATTPTSGLGDECVRVVGDALRGGGVTLEPADAARCAADAARALEGCDWVTPYAPRVPSSCRGVLHGRRVAGAACRSSIECVDGSFCWGSGPTTAGVCIPPAPAGATCGAAIDALATFARQTGDDRHPECAGYCAKGRCAAFVAVGGACTASEQCGRDAHCAAGRCVAGPAAQAGEACGQASCAGDLVCTNGVCGPPKSAGEACSAPGECAATCLPPGADKTRVCGMQCRAWPPAGYTPPVPASDPSRG
jgi:hypothetical protein